MFDFYPAYEEHFAQVQLSLFMLGMGATLSVGDFAGVLRRPRSLAVALTGQIVVSPLIALAVSHLFGLTAGIALGLILTAAMPGGATAKAFVVLARGSAPLAISLTVASTLAAIVTVPLTLQLCAANTSPPTSRCRPHASSATSPASCSPHWRRACASGRSTRDAERPSAAG